MLHFDLKIVVLCFSLLRNPAALVVDSSDQNVQEYNVDYYCCNPPPVTTKEGCEQIFSTNGTTFAHIGGLHKVCIAPCQKDGDKLKISECVDYTVHIFCKNGTFTTEERVHNKVQPCPQPRSSQTGPLPQGHVGLLLVALAIIGFFTNY